MESSLLVGGVLKFNVHGFARGKSGPTGCGGVLHDTEGCILTLFSGPLGVLDSNMTYLQAIYYALKFLRWSH
ncbi:hypothetical protein GQ457_02G025450 [Hibiscus cannabinus]